MPVTAFVAVLGPVVAYGAYQQRSAVEKDRMQAAFERHVAAEQYALELRIVSVLDAVRGLGSLYGASEHVTRKEFQAFTRDALSRHPEIRALEWAPRVQDAEREAHERAMRAEGLAAYRIVQADGQGAIKPADRRPAYFPVCYVEPAAGNEKAFGFDLASDATRREALARATEARRPAMTDPIGLVQDPTKEPAVLVLLGISGPDPDRQGVVLGVLRVADVARRGLAGSDPDEAPVLEYRIEDADVAGAPVTLVETPGFATLPSAPTVASALEIAGQTWRIQARATPLFLARFDRGGPWLLALIVGLVWELLLGLAVLATYSGWARARDREARTVQSVIRNLVEGVLIAAPDGEVTFVNEAAERLIGTRGSASQTGTGTGEYGIYRSDGVSRYQEHDLPLARALRGEVVAAERILVRSPEGRPDVWLDVTAAPLRDEKGRSEGGVLVMRDETARRQAYEHARRLANAVEQTADTVVITDARGTILYVNPAFESVTGFSRAEALGETPRLLKSGHHPESFYRDMWTTLLRGKAFRGTIVNQRKGGDPFVSEQTVTPMKDERGRVTHFVSVGRDVTEQRMLQQKHTEMRLAAEVQQRLYPREAPAVPGYDIAGAVFPAAETSGDYFDFVPLPGGDLLIAVGDVCGHGLGPALVMAETRAIVRSLSRFAAQPGEVLRQANALLAADVAEHMFVSMVLLHLDPVRGRIRYASAGHPDGYVLGRDGRVRAELPSTGMLLGVFADAEYRTEEVPGLEVGEGLLLLTDGATESRRPDGRFFGPEGVLQVVRENVGATSRAVVDALETAIDAFVGEAGLADDTTFVLCRRTETSNESKNTMSLDA